MTKFQLKRSLNDQTELETLRKVLELILNDVKQKKNNPRNKYKDIYFHIYRSLHRKSVTKSVGKECVKLVNVCLLCHHYSEAAKLLWILVQDNSVFNAYLFKAIMIVLENFHVKDRNNILWKFHSHMQNSKLISIREIQLEFMIFCLRHNVPDTPNKVQELIKRKPSNYLKRDSHLSFIFNGYKAYCEYIEWCKSTIGGILQSHTKASANKAVATFADIIEIPGNWDIFILKTMEILLLLENHTDLEKILVRYAELNPNHINALIYLCLYFEMYNPDSEVLMVYLSKLAEMCPSDKRVLLLLEKWNKLEINTRKGIKMVFMFLDYPTNGKNARAWDILSNYIHSAKISRSKKLSIILQNNWRPRRRAWLWMYFNPLQQSEENMQISAKLHVISYFEPNHIFLKYKEISKETSPSQI